MRDIRGVKEGSRATLREVAQAVGVSICTASVVLNGSSSGSRISPGTRTAVVDAAQRLGYRASQAPNSLSSGRIHVLGVVPAATDTNILLGPHIQLVLNGVVNETEKNGYDLSLITRCDQSRPSDVLDALLRGKVDGVIVIAPRANSRLLPLLRDESIPMVVIDGDPEQCGSYFILDNKQSVRLAIRHLVDLGHSKIGYIAGPQDLYAARIRKDAFFEAMQECRLQVHFEWIQLGTFTYQSGVNGIDRMLRNSELPSAIFCANDETAFGAIDALESAGLRVPEDISVLGFDDVPLASHSRPPLTTIRQPVDEISRAAARSLLENIEHGTPIRSQTFPGELIVRQSSQGPQ